MEKSKKRKQAADLIFILCFMVMLLLPFLGLDTTEEINSELENRTLTKWPGLYFDKLHNEWYGHYAEDRVAFRNAAIRLNEAVSFYLFGTFSEEMHMFGQEGYIFPADEGYVQNYQHLNTDEALVDALVSYLDQANRYATQKGALFVFMICPNKSSVYGRYMPKEIHVNEELPGFLELTRAKLTKEGVPFVIPDQELCMRSKQEQIYNVTYDCAHWNDLGALYGLSLTDALIEAHYLELPAMKREDFTLSYEEKQLEFLSLPIREEVPVLKLKQVPKLTADSVFRADVTVEPGNNMAYLYNENAENDRTILVLHDSFLDNRAEWYAYRYREVYDTSRVNYTHLQEYIDKIEPDVVLFELAERSFADDLGAYTQLGTLRFE